MKWFGDNPEPKTEMTGKERAAKNAITVAQLKGETERARDDWARGQAPAQRNREQ